MRIVLNSTILRAPRTGIGTYVSELTNALQKLETFKVGFFDGRQIRDSLNRQRAPVPSGLSTKLRNIPGAYALRRLIEQQRFDKANKTFKPDIYHDPSLWPLHFKGPTVMTVHDLTHIAFAHTQPQKRVREIERRLPAALDRAHTILVDSQFIANELQRHYHLAANKIVVAPLAHGQNFEPRRETQLAGTLNRFGLRHRQYCLFIGTLEPRKNLLLALRAYEKLPPPIRDKFPLVVAGGNGWLSRDIERELNKAAAAGYVRRLGYVDRDDLADILAGTKLFIFPSLYEGFGIPLLEAMASGVPVLSSNAACLPEVGGDAARYFDPADNENLMSLILELIDDKTECERLIHAGIDRAKLFSWEKCAAITAEVYRRAANAN